MGDHLLHCSGHEILATPTRALVWNETVFVADVHFGKDATFRSASLWTPPGAVDDNLDRLSSLLSTYQARRLVILGDLFHSSHASESVPTIRRWRDRHPDCEMQVIAGNHDRYATDIAHESGFEMKPEGITHGPWILRHHPTNSSEGFSLCGHIHPVAVLRGKGRQSLRLPCFVVSPNQCILPAFGAFTGGYPVRPNPEEEILVIADDTVTRVPARSRGLTS